MTASDLGKSQRHTLVALSVLSAGLALAVWMAAWRRSTPPPINRIPVPAQLRPIASIVHKAPPQAPRRHAFASVDGVARDGARRAPLEQNVEDLDTDPVDLEDIPVEDRMLLGADPRADVRGSSVKPPPTPPRAEVDSELRAPDDPHDFELPVPVSSSAP